MRLYSFVDFFLWGRRARRSSLGWARYGEVRRKPFFGASIAQPILLASMLAMMPALCLSAELVGRASVVDGDTLEIHGQRIRIDGIDAPESRQTCKLNGKDWRCGQAAALALSDWIGARTVTCKQTAVDRYKRVVARCTVEGQDVAVYLVREGWALDWPRYSKGEFRPHQDAAKTAGRGIWKSEFEPPWEWRSRH